MPIYHVTFRDGRVGRADGGLLAVTVRADDYAGVAEAVCQIADADLDTPSEVVIEQREDEAVPVGLVYCGFDTIGHFDIEEIPWPAPGTPGT